MKPFAVAADVLREALSRRWIVALGLFVTLLLVLVAWTLKVEEVDGALQATRLFGIPIPTGMPADVTVKPIFLVVAYALYYGGIPFGILACADFAPKLLAPGRIEQLLSLPIRRWELLLGSLLGVLALSTGASLYAAGGLALVLGVKLGVWNAGPFFAALLAGVSFTAIYAAMLALSVLVRSSSLASLLGFALLVFGVVASNREHLLETYDPGVWKAVFGGVTYVVPRISQLAGIAATLCADQPVDWGQAAGLVGGALAFGMAAFALGAAALQYKDC
jgi:Cu-processing system permease protein